MGRDFCSGAASGKLNRLFKIAIISFFFFGSSGKLFVVLTTALDLECFDVNDRNLVFDIFFTLSAFFWLYTSEHLIFFVPYIPPEQ